MNISDYLQTVGSPKIPSKLYGVDYMPMGGYLPIMDLNCATCMMLYLYAVLKVSST